MDPQTIVVWVSGCVLSAVIIYLISVCTMREKTYDEVMAEQRKQHEALLGKTKPDKKEKKKKAKKSKSDVKISSSEETVASEDATDGLSDDGVSKMVELELEPEVIEPGKHDTPKQSRKNKKSILHNKEEKSLVRKSMTVEEQFHPSNMPKDDVEMKYERERRLSEKSDTGVAAAPPVAPTKKEKKKKNKEPKPEPVEIQVEEVMQMQAAPTLQGKAPGQKKDKKNKYSEGDGTPESSEVSRLFTSVSSTKLSEKEIQGLIDVLLLKSDKPGATEKQWTKKSQKGDPLALISKQLEDKDQQLGEEKTKILAAGIRLKDLNKDLVQEKQRVSLLEKSLQEVDGRHKEEIKALHLRMQNTHTEHQNETQRLITQIQQQQATSGQNQAAMIQRLTEENNKLKEAAAAAQAMAHSQVDVGNLQQKLKIMETEMSSNILKLNTEQNNNQVLQNKLKKMEKERNDADQRKKETDSVLNRKMSEYENMSRELKQAKDSYNQVNQELASTRNQYQNVEQSRNQETEVIRDVKDKLNNAETANKQLEAKLSQVTKTRTEQDQQIQTLQASLQSLQSEKVSLQNTMLEMKTSATNGVAETSVKAEEVKQLSSAKDDLSKTVDSLKKELESKSTASDELSRTIESLQKDLDAQKKRNNDLSQSISDLQSSQDKYKSTEDAFKTLEDKYSQSSKQVTSLQEQLGAQSSELGNVQNQMRTVQNQLETVQSQFDHLTKEYNELKDQQNQNQQAASSDAAQIEAQLQEKKALTGKLEAEMATLRKENTELRLGCEQATHALTKAEKSAEEVTSQYQRDAKDKMAKIESLQVELETKNTQISSLKAQGADSNTNNSTSKEVDELKEQLKGKDGELEAMQNSVKFYWIQNEELNKKVESLEARKQQLESQQNGGGQLVDASRGSEIRDLESKVESYKTQCELHVSWELWQLQESAKRTSSDDDKLKVAREKWEGQIENALKEAFPNIKVKDTTRHEDFISIFRKELVQVVHSKSEEGSSEAVNSPQSIESSDTAEVSRLQAQVSHYQQVLADTERILNQLQNSVESEEQTWKQRIVNLEEENARLKKPSPSQPKDAKIIVTNGNSTTTDEDDIGFAYQCVGKSLDAIVAQMEDKVRELEERLSSSESEKLSLQSRLSESLANGTSPESEAASAQSKDGTSV